MPRPYTIDRSVNFNGISMTAGAWLMVIGIASFFLSIGKQNGYALMVAVIFLLLAAMVTLSIRHIAIDHELRRICCYTVYPSKQKCNWLPIDDYTGVVIQRITGTITIRSRNHYHDERYTTFAVSLTNADNSDRLLLRGFSEYADAIRFQDEKPLSRFNRQVQGASSGKKHCSGALEAPGWFQFSSTNFTPASLFHVSNLWHAALSSLNVSRIASEVGNAARLK